MARRSVLLLAAVVISLIGTALIVLYVKGIDDRATAGQDLVNVMVANAEVEPGEAVSAAEEAGKFTTTQVRRADLVAGALTSTKSIADMVSTGTIYPGEQLLSQQFGSVGETESLPIPDDKMAVSVELTDFERVAGFVNPGNDVAIFATALQPKRIAPDGTSKDLGDWTRILLTRVPVVGVGTTSVTSRTTQTDSGDQVTEEVPRTILTLALTQEQATRLIHADRTADLTFALLTDTTPTKDEPGLGLGNLMPELLAGRP